MELIPFEYKGHLEYKGPLTSTWDSDDAEQSHDDSDTRQYSAHDDHDSDTGGLYRSHDDDDDDDVDDDDGDDDDDDEEEEEEEEEEGNNTHPPYNNNKPPTIQFLHTAFSPSPVHRHEHTGIQLTLPYIPVLQQLRIKGYLQGAHRRGRHPTIKSNHKGSSYGPLVTRPHASILQYFNKRLHGLTALYACVANKGAVRGVLFHVKQSVACTLANKFKLQSMGKVCGGVVFGGGGFCVCFERGREGGYCVMGCGVHVDNTWDCHQVHEYNTTACTCAWQCVITIITTIIIIIATTISIIITHRRIRNLG